MLHVPAQTKDTDDTDTKDDLNCVHVVPHDVILHPILEASTAVPPSSQATCTCTGQRDKFASTKHILVHVRVLPREFDIVLPILLALGPHESQHCCSPIQPSHMHLYKPKTQSDIGQETS